MNKRSRYIHILVYLLLLSVSLAPALLKGQQTETWSVAPEPIVEFGVIEGNPNYVFASVRTAQFLPDHRIVVADAGMRSIRVYDAAGRFRVEMGNKGEGPGEIGFLGNVWLVPPDTIRLWDPKLRRITTYTADGSLVSTQKVGPRSRGAPVGMLDFAVGNFRNGDIAMAWNTGTISDSEDFSADMMVYGRVGSDGGFKTRLGTGSGLVRSSGMPVVFTPFPYDALYQDTIYFTNGVEGRIHVFGPKGRIHRVLEVPVSPVDGLLAWSSLKEELVADGDSASLRLARSRPHAGQTPALGGMFIDDRGLIWAKVYSPVSDPIFLDASPWGAGGKWWVVTRSGSPVAEIQIPDHLVPLDVRERRLLGLQKGPLDVARIVVHTINR